MTEHEAMKRRDGAKRLLLAMSDVSDSFIVEAAKAFSEVTDPDVTQEANAAREFKEAAESKVEKAPKTLEATDISRAIVSAEKINGAESSEKIKNLRDIRRIRRWTGIVCAAAACFAAVLIGIRIGRLSTGTGTETLDTEGSGYAAAESGTAGEFQEDAQAVNPYQEVDSLSEAESITGFGMEVPEAKEPYSRVVVNVIDGTTTEVDYYNADESVLGYSIRKAAGTEDISGDYNEYAETKTEDVDGNSVTLKGENNTWSLATWTADGYSYAVSASEHPLSEEQMLELVRATS